VTAVTTLADRLAARDAARFVGRERELAFFDSLLVDDPPAQVVLIHGPGGIGKSTLLREVARRGRERGWTSHVVEGRNLAPVPGEIEDALGDATHAAQPLILFDTYERMAAADGWLRGRLVPSLPSRSIVVLAGRTAPEPGWFEGGWEQLAVELRLEPLPPDAASNLVRSHGVADEELVRQLVDWGDGSPLALSLAADAARLDGGVWAPERIHEHPNLVQAILHRVARTELDGGNLDVAAVAAIARSCDARMLRSVLPEVDPDEAYAWLRSRTFAEQVGGGVTLHDIVRQAMRADLRARAPERDRELRRRIADHLFERRRVVGTRIVVDLAELVENPAIRWGFGADGSTTYRPDLWRADDIPTAREPILAKAGGDVHWAATLPLLEHADRVVTVRNAMDELCGFAIAVTPDNAPPVADEDPMLGPWLAYARRHHAGSEVLIWRDSIDFVAHGDLASPVLSILNTAAILRSGLKSPRFFYLPIDPENEAAVAFATAVNAEHIKELDVQLGEKVVQCHVLDNGPDGMLGGIRAAVYGELGLTPPSSNATVTSPALTAIKITVQVVRDTLRVLDQPLEVSASPLARGMTTEERVASVRAQIEDAVQHAFGASPDEQLLRKIIERGYLDPTGSHELAADELHVSRATYFRRLRVASQRVADYLIARHGG
jgi:hypothetical protein